MRLEDGSSPVWSLSEAHRGSTWTLWASEKPLPGRAFQGGLGEDAGEDVTGIFSEGKTSCTFQLWGRRAVFFGVELRLLKPRPWGKRHWHLPQGQGLPSLSQFPEATGFQ